MRRSVFLVFIIVVGVAALGVAPVVTTESPTLQKALPFEAVPTKLHDVIPTPSGVITQFLLRPNSFQTCACTVRGARVDCACVIPEAGICAETAI